jgi:hypothetical protein
MLVSNKVQRLLRNIKGEFLRLIIQWVLVFNQIHDSAIVLPIKVK